MNKISQLYTPLNLVKFDHHTFTPDLTSLGLEPIGLKDKYRINILALGDVGGTLLTGLCLLGQDLCHSIGIIDINPNTLQRYLMEMNQIRIPCSDVPPVKVYDATSYFDCDVFVFCATAGVPPVVEERQQVDVRMAQLEANSKLIETYANMAIEQGFKGRFFVISDPVDQLCNVALKCGLGANQVRGFGLGVMNGRAAFYDSNQYVKEGRVFGPHGQDLVVANSIENYDHEKSLELTSLTVNGNLEVRQLGFKPYIAPALSSGALSILAALRGQWQYSSVYMGQAFLGVKNRITESGDQIEDLPLPPKLFERIENAYNNLIPK